MVSPLSLHRSIVKEHQDEISRLTSALGCSIQFPSVELTNEDMSQVDAKLEKEKVVPPCFKKYISCALKCSA